MYPGTGSNHWKVLEGTLHVIQAGAAAISKNFAPARCADTSGIQTATSLPTNHRYRVASLLRQTNVSVASHILPLEVRALFLKDLDAVSPTAAGEGVIVDT